MEHRIILISLDIIKVYLENQNHEEQEHLFHIKMRIMKTIIG